MMSSTAIAAIIATVMKSMSPMAASNSWSQTAS